MVLQIEISWEKGFGITIKIIKVMRNVNAFAFALK